MLIVNNGGIFIVNLLSIGAIVILTKLNEILIWNSYVIFGFLLGSGLAYYLKGSSIHGTNQVAKSLKEDKPDILNTMVFLDNKLKLVVPRIMINLIVVSGIILILGVLFGGEALVGYLLGLNIVGAHISMLALITGTQLRNARHLANNGDF